MRLLHAASIQLKSFEENAIPAYVILSHTWGNDEVSFQDFHSQKADSKAGYSKIRYVCEDALRRGMEYVWVDTCCIDKSSSAELSEAINSMFRWYKSAMYCYAYLADVPNGINLYSRISAFATSRWFTRGWTLQELLAPADLYFFSSNGLQLGSKRDLASQISGITGISIGFLTGADPLSKASVSRKFSWASSRKTTRTEDLAYCLLGILGISMPLLYGEGDKAFIRLQEELMKSSDDHTLFAWGYNDRKLDASIDSNHGPFATEPAAFRDSGSFIPDELNESIAAYNVTNKGLQIHLPIVRLSRFPMLLAVLACRPEKNFLELVAIPVVFHSADSFTRSAGQCCIIRRDEMVHTSSMSLRFLTGINAGPPLLQASPDQPSYFIRKLPRAESGLCIWSVEPRDTWDPEQRIIRLAAGDQRHVIIRLWHKEGEGFAIVLPPGRQRYYRFSPPVFQETARQPLSYNFLPPGYLFEYYKFGRSSDVKVTKGDRDILMSTGIVIRTLDVELVSDEVEQTDIN